MYIGDLEVHPAAEILPEMSEDDFDLLLDSVRSEGILRPLDFYGGKLIDGRSRARAAMVLGISSSRLPKRAVHRKADPYRYVWEANKGRFSEEAAGMLKATLEQARTGSGRTEKGTAGTRGVTLPSADVKRLIGEYLAGRADASRMGFIKWLNRRGMTLGWWRLEKLWPAPVGGTIPVRPVRRPRRRSLPTTWRVPRKIPLLASFLRERLTTTERAELASLLAPDTAMEPSPEPPEPHLRIIHSHGEQGK